MAVYTTIIVILSIIFLGLSVVMVKEKTAVVIQRFGKYQRIATSGLSFKVPIIDTNAGILNMRIQQLDVAIETKTMDNVFVNMRVSVQYHVIKSKKHEAFYLLDDPESQISAYIFDDVRAEVPKMELDDLFAKKDDIANAVRSNLDNAMNEYGFQIVKALITDIDPDKNVKESMNRINAAKRDKEAALEEAEAEKITIVKKAEADAESKRLQGEGIAQQRLEIVKGFKESVEDFHNSLQDISSSEVMQFVLMTQYFDTLNNIGSNSKNSSILIPNSPGAMKDFQEQIIQGTFIGNRFNEHIENAEENKKD
jgi:regulator of protease activity HflC (stomatin/prohibitin superfamily)